MIYIQSINSSFVENGIKWHILLFKGRNMIKLIFERKFSWNLRVFTSWPTADRAHE